MLVTINILGLKRLILHNILQSKMANRREPAIKKVKKQARSRIEGYGNGEVWTPRLVPPTPWDAHEV